MFTASFGIAKGAIVGVVTLAVVASGLPTFDKAIILALLSGGIGVAGMLGAAYINARANAQMVILTEENKKLAEDNHALLNDLMAAQGLTKRKHDQGHHQAPKADA